MDELDRVAERPPPALPSTELHRKPSFYNYVLAHTFGFSVAGGAVAAQAVLFAMLYPEGTVITGWSTAGWVAVSAVITAAVGAIIGVFFIWPLFGMLASSFQGAPFRVGESVWILSGEHKDALTCVYEVWEERSQVRVNLGPDAKEEFEDVLCTVAVCRARCNARDVPLLDGRSPTA